MHSGIPKFSGDMKSIGNASVRGVRKFVCGLMICCMHICNLVTSCVVHCSSQ